MKIQLLLQKIWIILFCNSILSAAPVISVAQSQSAVVQNDGKMVVIGYATIKDTQQFLISRYNVDGSFDPSFGTNSDGLVTTPIGTRAEATCVAIQPDGKIIVGGFAIVNDITQFAIARYNTNGVLDSSFGQNNNGIVTQAVGGGCTAYSCVIQNDGNIVVAGAGVVEGLSHTILVRFNSVGIKDITFGENGIVTTLIGDGCSGQSVLLQNDGSIIVGGFARINSGWQMTLIRYQSDGNLDNTFGNQGIVNTVIGSESAIHDIKLDINNNIVAVGFSDTQMMIARYVPNGTIDESFGTNGFALPDINSQAVANSLAFQADGKIIVTGISDANFVTVRYTTSGILDTTFAENGLALYSSAKGIDCIVQSDDSIISIGFSDSDIVLIKYTSLGVIDSSWGVLGVINDPAGASSNIPVFIYDQKAIGTNGGTFTAGEWQTRDLNIISSINTNISLSLNHIVLQPGSYTLRISAPAYKVGLHQIRLQNITDNRTLAYGASAIASNSGSVTFSPIETNITINKVTTLAIQHKCTVTEQYDGLGIAGGFGDEIYTTVKISKT